METNYNWTSEDVALVEKYIAISNKGFYVNSNELTSTYNRILGKHAPNTTCGSCLKARVRELEAALNKFKNELELQNIENKVQDQPSESIPEVKEATDKMVKVRAARKKRKEG